MRYILIGVVLIATGFELMLWLLGHFPSSIFVAMNAMLGSMLVMAVGGLMVMYGDDK